MKLTPSSIALIALIFMVGITGSWAEAQIPWWRYLTAVLVLGFLFEWVVARQLDIRVQAPEMSRVSLGQSTTLSLEIYNASAQPISGQCALLLPPVIETSEPIHDINIASDSVCSIDIPIRANHLGEYRGEKLAVFLRGRMGLAHHKRTFNANVMIRVAPVVTHTSLTLLGHASSGRNARYSGSGFELHHQRDYSPGDPIRSIDWKASARSQRLTTRMFSEEQRLDIALVVDCGRTSLTQLNDLTQLGHFANLASSFAQYAVSQGDRIGLIAMADDPLHIIAPASNVQVVREIHETFTRIQPKAVETDFLAAALQVQHTFPVRGLVVVLTDFYNASVQGALGQAIKLVGTRHLPMVVGLLGDEVFEATSAPAVSPATPYSALAAREYQHTLHSNSLAARRLGAHVVISSPQQLQQRVLSQYQLLKRQRRI